MTTRHPRRATTRAIVTYAPDDVRHAAYPIAALEAAVTVRAARRNQHKMFDAVHVYTTTDRTGAPLVVAYVHYRPDFYTAVNDYTELYEIPLDALTDL